MNRKKWEEKMNETQKEEMQKYKEFNKDNFKELSIFPKFLIGFLIFLDFRF